MAKKKATPKKPRAKKATKKETDDGIRTAEEAEATTAAAEEGVSEPATEPADVEPEDGAVGEPEPEPDSEPVGDVEPEQEKTDGATEGDAEAGEAEAAVEEEVAEEEVEGAVGTIDETTEVVEAPPPIQIPNQGAIVLVTDEFGNVHEAVIVRKITKGDEALIVCTKDGSDDQMVLVHGAVGERSTWAAPR